MILNLASVHHPRMQDGARSLHVTSPSCILPARAATMDVHNKLLLCANLQSLFVMQALHRMNVSDIGCRARVHRQCSLTWANALMAFGGWSLEGTTPRALTSWLWCLLRARRFLWARTSRCAILARLAGWHSPYITTCEANHMCHLSSCWQHCWGRDLVLAERLRTAGPSTVSVTSCRST